MSSTRDAVDYIENLIHEDVGGRNINALCAASRGGLWRAASALVNAKSVAIISGFYVPSGEPQAAETDGPVGAAMLARALGDVDIECRLATDEPCTGACAAAVDSLDVPLDIVPLGGRVDDVVELWRKAGVTHVISIERCGRSMDGKPRNMRGDDISGWTTPLDELFLAGPWHRLAIGDGGNEIGMGSLSRSLIVDNIENGEEIACVTAADDLIVAGVSNWGAYGLVGAMALLRGEWREALASCLDEARDGAVLKAVVDNGPAVDGVSRKQTYTVDNLPIDVHHAKLRAIRKFVEANG